MPFKHVTKYGVMLIAVSLISCTALRDNSSAPSTDKKTTRSAINSALDQSTWTTWRCKDGSTLKTRFKGHDRRLMELNYQGSRHVLIRQSNRDPLIYQDGRIAFFSEGQSAIIGQPESDLIYNSGCRIVP